MTAAASRRTAILDAAAAVFAGSGPRASLREIADACGILPGSLYHHFESKDAIVVELVDRYRADLATVAARSREALKCGGAPSDGPRLVVDLSDAIAACATRHRAAAVLSLFEPPSSASHALATALSQPPSVVEEAMLNTLQAGERAGWIRPGLDLVRVAERICNTMLNTAAGRPGGRSSTDRLPALKSQIVLCGIATDYPTDARLDRSSAKAAADDAITGWRSAPASEQRLEALHDAARREFGRRGYEATTIRDVARAAAMSTGTVYRLVGSKEQLVLSVMRAFTDNITAGWESVLHTDASTVEKLDALLWVNVNVLDRFREEFRIQLGGFVHAPTDLAEQGWAFSRRLAEIAALLRQGSDAGELRLPEASSDDLAWSILELVWLPESIVTAGAREALALGRDCVLRGIAAER